MILTIVLMAAEIVYALAFTISCECFGASGVNIICWLHFFKIALNLYNMQKFYSSMKDKIPNHALSNLNGYLTLFFYEVFLFVYLDDLVISHLCVYNVLLYPFIDFIILLVTGIAMKKVLTAKRKIICDPDFKSKSSESIEKLKEIVYLPVDYETDIDENEDE